MSDDKVSNINSQLTNESMEMQVKELIRVLPYQMQINEATAKLTKAKYDSLIEEGFTEEQALKIVCEQPLNKT